MTDLKTEAEAEAEKFKGWVKTHNVWILGVLVFIVGFIFGRVI